MTKFNPETDLPVPETLEQAIRERNNWCATAAQHYANEQYYRGLVQKIAVRQGAGTRRGVVCRPQCAEALARPAAF